MFLTPKTSLIRRAGLLLLLPIATVMVLPLSGCSTTRKSDGVEMPEPKSPRERAQLLIEAANGSLLENDPIGALQFLERAEKLDPKYAPIYHAKALAFSVRKDFPAALREMKKSVDLDPENPFALNTYGKFLLDAGRLDEAEAPLMKALKKYVRDIAEALQLPPELLIRKKEYEAIVRYGMKDGTYALPERLLGWRYEVIGKGLLVVAENPVIDDVESL